MKIAVLGAGMVGRAISLDLASRHEVTSIDISELNLGVLASRSSSIQILQANLADYTAYADILRPFDMVVTAVPGFMGFKTLRSVIEAGKNVVDISFFPENALELDSLAKEKSVTVITDCGVAPGMSNLIIGRYNEEMKLHSFEIYVGGLPRIRKKPFEYKAPFSPVDVIEEYTRPARMMENGEIIIKPALSEREWMFFEDLGTLEAFNTDGLRSLLYTMSHVPNQKEKTLRYPGHVDLIIALKESGFFSELPVLVNGNSITPLQFSSSLLFNEWKLGPEEEELTVMKVVLNGEKAGKKHTVQYNLLDYFDPLTMISSMSRATGYTCTAAVNLVADGLFKDTGVFPPEYVGKEETCFDYIMNYLKDRGVNWKKNDA